MGGNDVLGGSIERPEILGGRRRVREGVGKVGRERK
jgi:hypothetical protein